ncbi:biliverdin-producing heme oxygenase [Pseudomonas sp. NPDC089734]|uniref:biliverdin-producing heme oxygenase n=1 Tax=Pseudomonas sp. NPDC089734 TaxID=3364469 RepID=UPI003820523F
MSTATLAEPLSRAKQLKASTHTAHEKIDKLVMRHEPFQSLESYGHFLRLQHVFHGALEPVYLNENLNNLLPGLSQLNRFPAVEADLNDLEMPIPPSPEAAAIGSAYQALGWLYCSEGSNLGAAILFKHTRQLNLHETHGARHLAAHEDGRALHWRAFVQQLDALELTEEQDQEVIAGARAAFDFYRDQLHRVYGEVA